MRSAVLHDDTPRLTEVRHSDSADPGSVSDARFRAVVEAASDAILTADSAGRIASWNSAAARTFGYSEKEILGQPLQLLLPEAFRHAHSVGYKRVAQGGTPHLVGKTIEVQGQRRSGEVFPLELSLSMWTENGERFFTGIIRDISERKHAEEQLRRQHELLMAVLNSTTDAMWVKDLDGCYRMINPAGARMLECPAEEVIGRRDDTLFSPESAADVMERDRHVIASGSLQHFETVAKGRDGVERAYLTTRVPLRDGEGRVTGTVGVSRDITERKTAERAVHDQNLRLQLLLDQLPAVLWSTDHELRFTSSLGAGLSALGLQPGQVVGMRLTDFFGTEDLSFPPIDAQCQALRGNTVTYETEFQGRTFATHVQPFRDANGSILGGLGLGVDVTERKKLEQQLERFALYDSLTGLPNRTLFRDRIRHALGRAAGPGQVSVLLLNLDHFQTVLEAIGFEAAGVVITQVAVRLLDEVRRGDTVARVGDDTFGVLLEELSNEREAAAAAARFAECLRVPFPVADKDVAITASVGVAVAHGTASALETPEDLMRNAGAALHRARVEERGTHVVYSPDMHAELRDRMALETDLRAALGRGELRVEYQPLVHLASERVTGVEALLRWDHPTRGSISPGEFIPLAEEIGVIDMLGRWVLKTACEQVAAWEAQFPECRLNVSVNLSIRQLTDGHLVDELSALLARLGLAPRRLVLEITESVVMQDSELALQRLRRFKGLGVRIAIDDFGTGFSALSYLRRFPVDILKIDKTFIAGLGEGADESVLATTIVTLASSLSLQCVAEGVEREVQRTRLRELGCDFGQGFLFARPMKPAVVEAILARGGRLT